VDSPDPDFEEIFHYADFEGKLVHEKIIPGMVNKIYAQVHNRGVNKVTDTKVRLFYARVAAVLPHLPSDFWSAGKPFDTNPSGTDWLPVGPVMYLGDLEPAKPKLGAWDWFVPPDLPEHTCLLALTTCKEDPLIGTGMFDVDTLVRQNKRVALKNIHPVHSGLDGLSPKEAMILDFNHKAGSSSICDLGIEWGSLPPDAILLIAFEKLSDKKIILAKPEDLTKAGISMAKNKEKYFKEKINYKCGEIKYLDLNHVYQITRNNVNFSKIPSISIPEDKNVVTIAINLIFSKPPPSERQFNIFQIIGKKISGGVTYIFKPNSIQ